MQNVTFTILANVQATAPAPGDQTRSESKHGAGPSGQGLGAQPEAELRSLCGPSAQASELTSPDSGPSQHLASRAQGFCQVRSEHVPAHTCAGGRSADTPVAGLQTQQNPRVLGVGPQTTLRQRPKVRPRGGKQEPRPESDRGLLHRSPAELQGV